VLNSDCPETATLAVPAHLRKVTFSLEPGADLVAGDIALTPFGAEFTLDGARWRLNVPGRHNVSNALAAVAVARHFGAAGSVTRAALEAFRGVARRFEVIGSAAGVTVIDDFAHNPDKIRATLEALAVGGHRNLLVFQCHGFGPTLFMKDELIDTLTRLMRADDHIYFPEIFYAGGTANRSISAADLVDALRAAGKNAHFSERRDDLPPLIAAEARTGDVVTVMGARDDTLTDFCRDILAALAK
jgi:UDP-N-acetylmuramate--alanine ligase